LIPRFDGNVLETTSLVNEIFTKKDSLAVADLAFSAQSYLAKGLAQLAVREAEQLGVEYIGFSGGVAYNENITSKIRKAVERESFKFFVHQRIPAGDGGTSFGQAIVASFQK
jgi:hydrogenase maturation protein HypF